MFNQRIGRDGCKDIVTTDCSDFSSGNNTDHPFLVSICLKSIGMRKIIEHAKVRTMLNPSAKMFGSSIV